jgi:hypothetical protein
VFLNGRVKRRIFDGVGDSIDYGINQVLGDIFV